MTQRVYVKVNALPASVQRALEACGYHKADLPLEARDTVNIMCAGGNGYRSFAVILNLETGARTAHYGSWGGPNPFAESAKRRVDSDDTSHTIPPNGAVILGSEEGGKSTLATLIVRPDAMPAYLPAAPTLSEIEIAALHAYRLKSGPYRQDALRASKATPDVIDSLVARGYLSRNRAGATTLTTEGKNVVAQTKAPSRY